MTIPKGLASTKIPHCNESNQESIKLRGAKSVVRVVYCDFMHSLKLSLRGAQCGEQHDNPIEIGIIVIHTIIR